MKQDLYLQLICIYFIEINTLQFKSLPISFSLVTQKGETTKVTPHAPSKDSDREGKQSLSFMERFSPKVRVETLHREKVVVDEKYSFILNQ